MTGRAVRKAVRFGVDFALPVALYYVLRAAGISVYGALLLTTVPPATMTVLGLVRSRRLDGMSAYATCMLLLSVAVSFIPGSTQLLLARESVATGVTGIWFIVSARTDRPLAYLFSRPLLEGRLRWPGDWDGLWSHLPRFRRMWRISSICWGVGTLTDATVRVVLAYTVRADIVPALSTALFVSTSAVLIAGTTVLYVLSGVYNPNSTLYRQREGEAVTARG